MPPLPGLERKFLYIAAGNVYCSHHRNQYWRFFKGEKKKKTKQTSEKLKIGLDKRLSVVAHSYLTSFREPDVFCWPLWTSELGHT